MAIGNGLMAIELFSKSLGGIKKAYYITILSLYKEAIVSLEVDY